MKELYEKKIQVDEFILNATRDSVNQAMSNIGGMTIEEAYSAIKFYKECIEKCERDLKYSRDAYNDIINKENETK